MASSPSAYGERPPLQSFRRSFTVPHRQLSFHERAGLSNADADSETLFTHPSVKIISFSPPPESIVSKSTATDADADYPIDTVETLPWRSRTEDLAASGRMIIEKVRGSVWFLKCGSQFVYSILRNSQCWCVDGESKFVWRKGRLQYYRLELPIGTDEEKAKVEELKVAFAKILKFEKTPCPFKRGFHVHLPDDAITPRRKGKWIKKEGSLPNTPDSGTPSLRRTKGTRSWSLQSQSPLPVPESRRQSDYNFAKKLYPTPPRRDTLSGLRPRTPSSTASSEEVASQGQHDENSDSGSSVHEAAPVSKDEAPAPTAEEAVKLDEPPGEDMQREVEAHHDEDDSTAVSAAKLPVPQDAPSPLAEDLPVPFADHESSTEEVPVSEDDFVHVTPPDVDTTEEEAAPLPSSLTEDALETISSDGAHPEEVSPDQPDEVDTMAQEPSPPEISTSSQAASIQESETTPVEKDEEPSLSDKATNQEEDSIEELEVVPIQDSERPLPQIAERMPDNDRDGPELDVTPEPTPGDDGGLQQVLPPDAEGQQLQDPQDPTELISTDEIVDDTASIASTTESFHTVASEDQPPPDDSPAIEQIDPRNMRHFQHKRGVSEMTITASKFDSQDADELERFVTTDEAADRPATPRLIQSSASDDSWPDVKTPSNIQDGLRQRLKSRRSYSPLPSSSNIFSAQSQNHGNHMTSVLLQKACNLALVKPIEMVVLVVHILARIAGGASLNDLLTGELFKKPDQHKRNSSFPDRIPPHQDDDEDDYGVPIRGRTRSSETNVSKAGQDTDTDSLFDLD